VQPIRQVFFLADQVIGWFPDRGLVIAAQRWTGFVGGRHAFAMSVNDVVSAQRAGTPGAVNDSFVEVAAKLHANFVTEEQARRHLAEIGHDERKCRDCSTRLPIGWLYCTGCGLPRGGHETEAATSDAFRVASVVSLSPVRARPPDPSMGRTSRGSHPRYRSAAPLLEPPTS
jgi:hypothetical protein